MTLGEYVDSVRENHRLLKEGEIDIDTFARHFRHGLVEVGSQIEQEARQQAWDEYEEIAVLVAGAKERAPARLRTDESERINDSIQIALAAIKKPG